MIPLNGFLLRRGMDPELTLSEEARKHASHHLWADGHLEALNSSSPAYQTSLTGLCGGPIVLRGPTYRRKPSGLRFFS